MEVRPFKLPQDELAAFCRQHHIAKLSLFGSALREDFSASSDVDFLVEFEQGHTPGFLGLAAMERELSTLLGGRPVDLRTPRTSAGTSATKSWISPLSSMQEKDKVRLRHMLDAAEEARAFAQGHSRSSLDTDRMLVLALLKCIEIIGEAAARISDESKAMNPSIPSHSRPKK